MIYNLYAYFFQDSFNKVLQFRIDLSKHMVFRFELDDAMMPVKNRIFMFDVEDLKIALTQIISHLTELEVNAGIPVLASPDAIATELLQDSFKQHGDLLYLFGDPMKYEDQTAVAGFLLQSGQGEALVKLPGSHYLLKDFSTK